MADPDAIRSLVAFLYQRSGRTALSENELANAVSLDLKWYAPKAARSMVAGLVRAGWLERDEDGDLEPTFDPKAVKVPIGFHPPADLPGDLPPPGTISTGPAATDRTGGGSPFPEEGGGVETREEREDGTGRDLPGDHDEGIGPSRAAEADEGGGPDDGGPVTFLGELLGRLEAETGAERAVWVARMDAVVQATADAVGPEVALLIAAAKEGVDVAPWIEEARRSIASTSH